MKNPVEQINNIANMDDFLTFVVQLAISKINIYFTWKRVVKQSIALFFVIGNKIPWRIAGMLRKCQQSLLTFGNKNAGAFLNISRLLQNRIIFI